MTRILVLTVLLLAAICAGAESCRVGDDRNWVTYQDAQSQAEVWALLGVESKIYCRSSRRWYMSYAWNKDRFGINTNRLFKDGMLVGFLRREGDGETAAEWLGFVVVPSDGPDGSYVGTFLTSSQARAEVLKRAMELA